MSPRVFILTHNPTLSWSINEQPGWVEDTKHGVPIDGQWSVGIREDIDPGDVGFLLRQKDRRGIIAKCVFELPRPATIRRVRAEGIRVNGKFDRVVYKDWHWIDSPGSKSPRLTRYADLSWRSIVDTADRLPVEELKRRFKTADWDMMFGSGVEVKGAAGQRLIQAWDDHLRLLVGDHYVDEPDDELVEHREEGRPVRASVTRFERVPANRRACLEHHGFTCAACGFDFEAMYGPRGADYIQVHHKDPLANARESRKVDPVKDLVPLCANCHVMVHRHLPILTIPQLRRMIRNNA